jgi:5-methylcytosine-specific restriction enzyme B
MPDYRETALDALKKMRSERGDDTLFSSDEIWQFTDTEIPSTNRPSAIVWLQKNRFIEPTGRMRNAVSEARAGSKTTEYKFVLDTEPPVISIDNFCGELEHDCKESLRVNSDLLLSFASSLLSKRFLILTGLAGSGKTKLAQAFAQWITPKAEANNQNPHYTVIPVGADWTGNENMLGYPNGLNESGYVSKPALDLILHAQAHHNIPHFLLLDEMNLSHVERYFADFLSAIESEEEIQLHSGLERTANGQPIPQSISLPKNLFVIGTVNVDETTYMFSPKVLDRANVIEFRMEAAELEAFLGNPAKPDLSRLNGKGAAFGQAFVEAAKGSASIPSEVRSAFEVEMLLYFKVLQEHGAEFGYRVAHEAARFIHFYQMLGNCPDDDIAWFASAFDCVVVQKILPKLHGSRAKLGPLLKALWFLATQPREYAAGVSDNVELGAGALEEAQKKATDTNFIPSITASATAPHPLSANKIARMWKLLNDNGFASFAEA